MQVGCVYAYACKVCVCVCAMLIASQEKNTFHNFTLCPLNILTILPKGSHKLSTCSTVRYIHCGPTCITFQISKVWLFHIKSSINFLLQQTGCCRVRYCAPQIHFSFNQWELWIPQVPYPAADLAIHRAARCLSWGWVPCCDFSQHERKGFTHYCQFTMLIQAAHNKWKVCIGMEKGHVSRVATGHGTTLPSLNVLLS